MLRLVHINVVSGQTPYFIGDAVKISDKFGDDYKDYEIDYCNWLWLQLFWWSRTVTPYALQVIEVVVPDTLQHHHRALSILRTPSLPENSTPCAYKAPIEISFFFFWGTYLTSFSSLTISSNILIRTVPTPSILQVKSSFIYIKAPSSFSKLAKQSRLG